MIHFDKNKINYFKALLGIIVLLYLCFVINIIGVFKFISGCFIGLYIADKFGDVIWTKLWKLIFGEDYE